MARNHRQHKRFKTDHKAHIMLEGWRYAPCRIRNYSTGGLYLQVEHLDKLIQSEEGDNHKLQKISARITIQRHDAPSMPPLEIPVHITHTRGDGFGIAFMESQEEVTGYLQGLGSSDHRETSNNSKDTPLTGLQNRLRDYLKSQHEPMVRLAKEALLEASDTASQQHQSELIYASNSIWSDRDALLKRLLEQIDDIFEYLTSKGTVKPDDSQELALIDQNEFDEWVDIVTLARRIDSRLMGELNSLSQCITYLIRTPVNNDSNPVSPYKLIWAFKNALQPCGFGKQPQQICFQVFAEQILAQIQGLYQQMLSELEKQGITNKASVSEKAVVDTTPDQPDHVPLPTRKPKNLINILSGAMGGGKKQKKGDTRSSTHQVSSHAAISNTLDSLVQGNSRHLADRIEHQLGGHAAPGGELHLSTEDRQTIDATEKLVIAIQQDPRHNSETRQLLKQIQLPLAKAALDNPAILNDPNHTSRQLLNEIDQLALFTSDGRTKGDTTGSGQKLQGIIAALEAAGGKADLEQVRTEISTLLDEQKSSYKQNLTQVIDGCKDGQHTQDARSRVKQLLTDELGDEISVVVDRLLKFGWTGLLIIIASDTNRGARRWKAYCNVLSLLIQLFQPDRYKIKLKTKASEQLMQMLRKGFKTYNLNPEESGELIGQIKQVLDHDNPLFQELNSQRVAVTQDYIESLLPPQKEPVREPTPQASESYLKLAASIQIGDWIVAQQQQGHVRALNLAWQDFESNRCIFVGGDGAKALDCTLNELALGFEQSRYSQIDDGGLPLVERAVSRVLKQTFERLRIESDSDPLTGLFNRRAYDRELIRLIQISQDEGSQQILICLDIDQFSLVNELCGIAGGDQLLSKIATICDSYLSRPNMLARTGDNKFSILIEHCSAEEGFQIAESQRRAIENYRYSWDGNHISTTVSAGLVTIDKHSAQPDYLTQAANSACSLAKSDGGNCCRLYQPDEDVYSQRKRLAQAVPVIEKALEENQLGLAAQIITPVFAGEGKTTHHEILLRVLDEEGQTKSPVDFIQAAERYDRMRAVDHWVINRFFQWAEAQHNLGQLQKMGGFNLNLSGQSMNDPAFEHFLKEKIQNSPLPTELLAFEITETSVVTKMEQVKALVNRIRALGCKFYLDDFGSGYASYSYLKELPVDVIKIDGIFVKELVEDETSRAMVKSITEVSHQMGKQVVAEFVENEAILFALRDLEVDFAQGYGVGRPVPLSKIST